MASMQQAGSYTPLGLARQQASNEETATKNVKTLPEQISELKNIAAEYDDDFAQHFELLGPLADTIDGIYQHRRAATDAFAEDLEKLIDNVERVKAKANSTEEIDAQTERVNTLNRERTELRSEIFSCKEGVNGLKAKLQEVEEELSEMRLKKDAITEKEAGELVTLQYVQKILRSLSGAKITSSHDSATLEGFVCKKDSHEVLPFKYDREMSQSERVNHLWDLIGKQ